jgi:serine/threonine-protein kinase
MGIAAALSHPRIVPLVDSGDADGRPYYIMPYLEGESLFALLERERRLPVHQALRIALDVADALAYAHGRGIIHRDVKPENILLACHPRGDADKDAEWHAMLMDFGLALTAGPAEHTRLTETGMMVGTVYYMSPEQLHEERGLDQRSDIYSLGCTLFEMLSGGPPFVDRSLSTLVTRILRAPMPPLRQINPSVPPGIERAIGRALAKSPAERFATMAEFAAALIAA